MNEYLEPALKKNLKIAIAGAGLAGLTAAIDLLRAGFEVHLVEKDAYPKHKVCGEYISNEILPYWQSLGINPFDWGAVQIEVFELSSRSGKTLKTALPLGGFGISRYTLDSKLAELAKEKGGTWKQDTVERIEYKNAGFEIFCRSGESFESDLVIGSFGKRSVLDAALSRKFFSNKTPWMGVKAHYEAEVPENVVSLHSFNGGYCGISKVENNRVNVCYLTHLDAFKASGNLEGFQHTVLSQNPQLKSFFDQATPVFEKPLSISQISFQPKELITNHILMCGDSAGLIHPLCGNGMAMAVHSAKILSECIVEYHLKSQSREELEKSYSKRWKSTFSGRLQAGRILQRILQHETATNLGIKSLQWMPGVLPKIISLTHGKPLEI
ncbi:NAD(P)/FAD-dependent oxidoreductase [Leeuwenhoekiella nanhaiensis]|uniref:NAD(P)/FAD-dependent oxidoreductase n=1 Tax=Leeuwenhoekiella nanhaiensis TaxID=1655491 RepID=UPI001CB9A1AE|nr:NAD(P)/FAD-dependent oxidoreductase [Leeuwenhoekiella nanhaiensis]